MKDVKEALYCMGQMADKCLTSLSAIQKDHKEFVSLVKRMREAQKELDTCSIGDYDFRQHCAAQLESEVDEFLKKMEDPK